MPDPKKIRKIYDWKTRTYVDRNEIQRKKPTLSDVKKAILEEDILANAVETQENKSEKTVYRNMEEIKQRDITQLSDNEINSAVLQSMALKQIKQIGMRTYQLVCLFPPQCRNRAPKDLMERPDLITVLEDFRGKIERCLQIICKDEWAVSNDFNNKGLRIAFKSEQDCHDFIYIHKNFFTQLNGKLYVRDTDTNHTEEYEITETKKGYLII
jgi:hypothetical protein